MLYTKMVILEALRGIALADIRYMEKYADIHEEGTNRDGSYDDHGLTLLYQNMVEFARLYSRDPQAARERFVADLRADAWDVMIGSVAAGVLPFSQRADHLCNAVGVLSCPWLTPLCVTTNLLIMPLRGGIWHPVHGRFSN